MPVNRLLGMYREQNTFSAAAPLQAARTAPAFAVCPVAFALTAWQQRIYQSALEHARETVASARFLRKNVILWN
jgi:hypothetical protein